MSKVPDYCLGCKLWLEAQEKDDEDSFRKISKSILKILQSFNRRLENLEKKVK